VDIETHAGERLHRLLDDLGPARLEQAPHSWRPCRPHVEGLRRLPLEPWMQGWVSEHQDRVVAETIAAARRYLGNHRDPSRRNGTDAETAELLAAMAALLRERDQVLATAPEAAAAGPRRSAVTLAEAIGWARADPRRRDAMLAIAERAVTWQPAAEVVIQFGLAGEQPPGWAGEAGRVQDAYRTLSQQLEALGRVDRLGGELEALLEEHLELVARALPGQASKSKATRAERRKPTGLGPVAGRLVALRDLLRSTAPVDGRSVVNLELPDRL
jgi:hypothetical protein